MKKPAWAALAALGVSFALGASGVQADSPLSGKALKGLFPGSFHAVYKSYKVNLTAAPNGVLHGDYNGLKDEGRWRVKGGQLCISTKKWLKGKTHCSPVVVRDGWYQAKVVKFRKGHKIARTNG